MSGGEPDICASGAEEAGVSQTWLHIVGIGEDGMSGLLPATRAVVVSADVIVGGDRHDSLSDTTRAERLPWPEAFDALIEAIETSQDLAQFLLDAAEEASHIGAYEHGSSGIRSYWDSLAGVVGDGADGLSDNPWRAFAEMLSGALIYE